LQPNSGLAEPLSGEEAVAEFSRWAGISYWKVPEDSWISRDLSP